MIGIVYIPLRESCHTMAPDLYRDFIFRVRPHILQKKSFFVQYFFIAQIDSSKCLQSTVKISEKSTIYFMHKKNNFIQTFLCGNSSTGERHKTVQTNLPIAVQSLPAKTPTFLFHLR